jgi:signal transduction histidine kinase
MQDISLDELLKSVILVLYRNESEIESLTKILDATDYNYKFVQVAEFNYNSLSKDIGIVLIGYLNDSSIIEQITKKVNDYSNQIPVIFSFKPNEIDLIEKLFKYGVSDFVIFPYNKSGLQTRIENHLRLINYQKEWQKEKKHLEHLNKEKNEILAIAAHDLKNPIFSIQLLGKTIRDDTSLTKEELFEFSNDIVASCDRIIDIIKQLLDLNSIESGKIVVNISVCNIIEPIQHLIELYRFKSEKKNIKLHYEFIGDGIAKTDLNAVKNIFDNFISNAIKYSPYDKTVFIKVYDNADKLVIDVSDEGPGIPEAEKDKLFKRFSKISNKPTGGENSTGLGLSIVKKFSELVDAEISFKNNENTAGATFSVILPKS